MKKHKLLSLLLIAALAISLAGCGSSAGGSEIRFGTGGIGGNYYAYGNAFGQFLEDDTADQLSLKVKTTAGSAANLRLLSENYLKLAIVQSDTLLDAVKGSGVFEGDARSGFRALAGLYTESCQIVVPADSDIHSIKDLIGKRVSTGPEDSGVIQNAEQILLANGISLNMIQASNLTFSESADALIKNEIDAFFCTAGAPTTAVIELASSMDIRLIPLDDRTIQELMQLYSCYSRYTIPAGTYPCQTEDVETIGVKAVLVAGSDVTDSDAEAITRCVFEHASELQYATGSDIIQDAKTAASSIPVEFHPGAVKYYESQGIDVTAEDNN